MTKGCAFLELQFVCATKAFSISIFEELIIEPKGKDMQLDHIVPHSRQGKSTPDNIIPVHKMCNQAKTSMTMEELIELSKKVVKTHG